MPTHPPRPYTRPGQSPEQRLRALALDATIMLTHIVPVLESLVAVPAIKATPEGQKAAEYLASLIELTREHMDAALEIARER